RHWSQARVCNELSSLGLMTAIQPAATAEASLAERKNEFAFQGVIRPAAPTGSSVTVVLPQLRVSGSSWSAVSAERNTLAAASIRILENTTVPPYSSTITAVRSST